MKPISFAIAACLFAGSFTLPQNLSSFSQHAGCVVSDNSDNCPANGLFESLVLEIKRTLTCGGGKWTEVANLDMTDSSQSCPSPWIEESSPSRLCGSTACRSRRRGAMFQTPISYSRVCGRVTGVTAKTPDAFATRRESINRAYVDGVSITYGSPRNHIWTFAAGHDNTRFGYFRCPCATSDRSKAPLPPSFVGEHYFCASVKTRAVTDNVWDGTSCSGPCCHFHSPPWFSVTLQSSTSDSIEVRICTNQRRTDESVFIQQLQIFVQ